MSPAAYLLEQGFAWHCIEETLGHVLPDNRKAALRGGSTPEQAGPRSTSAAARSRQL